MKKILVFLTGMMLLMQLGYSQNILTLKEGFDAAPAGWKTTSGLWVSNGTYYVINPSGQTSKSYLGLVPYQVGDTCILETPEYSFSTLGGAPKDYQYAFLRFSHICKISPNDVARIEYSEKISTVAWTAWKPLPAASYKGTSNYKTARTFNAVSYTDWVASNDNALPTNSWWKEELFDLENEAGYAWGIKFRFVIQHGAVAGTQGAYGWLIENFELIGANQKIDPPIVKLVSPFVSDTITNTGPCVITADIKSSIYAIASSYVKWTTNRGVSYDSVPMTQVPGGSLWKGSIPQIPAGNTVFYSVIAKDTTGIQTTVTSWYHIKQSCGACYANSAATISIDITDTVPTSPTRLTPIFATIKNKGTANLNTVTISYTVNGGTPVSKTRIFSPALPWDFNFKDSLGSYNARVNGYDTIVVWVSGPNGVPDSLTTDDTWTKRVYGVPDLSMAWVTAPTGTVYSTGPHTITARITSRSGQPINAVSLYIEKDTNSVTTYETLPMQPQGGGLWTAYPSNIFYNTDVRCRITMIDVVGNTVELLRNFRVEKSGANNPNSVAMDLIINPKTSSITSTVPVIVRIRNRGTNNLTSCYINYSVNGTPQIAAPGYLYTPPKSLPDGFVDTINLGSYTQQLKTDQIAAWVSMPNGVADPVVSDDTLKVSVLGCTPSIATGYVTVGPGLDFPTIAAALQEIQNCGMSRNTTLALKGTFTAALNLANLSTITNGYHLTITSLDNHRDSAVIRPTSGIAVTLNNTRNLTLDAITIDGRTTGTHALQFAGTCTNIVIRNCNILSDTVTTASIYPVHKASVASVVVDSFRMVGCLLDGGYCNFYFYGGNSNNLANTNTNIIIDSNIFQNAYYYGMYSYYTRYKSISYNKFYSRKVNNHTSYWYAMPLYNCHLEKIVGNSIIQRNNTTSYPYGIYMSSCNNLTFSPPKPPAVIANNEIRLNYGSASGYGMYATGGISGDSGVYILNNSVYLSGTAYAGLYLSPSSKHTIKNNMIYVENNYPIYLATTFNANLYDIDYNNLYAPQYVGYNLVAITSMSQWQQGVTTDKNSIRIRPSFQDVTLNPNPAGNLKLIGNFTPYFCPAEPLAPADIKLTPRGLSTIMGCYEAIPPGNTNVTVADILGLRKGHIAGQCDSVFVDVINTGKIQVTNLNIEWSVNGVSKGIINRNVSLTGIGQSTKIYLGNLCYVPGDMEIKVWLNSVNGTLDDYRPDDTMNSFVFVCVSGGYSGVMNIGPNSAYPTLQDAYNVINVCGLGGDITFAFENGIYERNFSFKNSIFGNITFGIYTVTITSQSGNRDDVIFRFTSSPGIELNGTYNLVIKSVTLDARTNNVDKAIQFVYTSASADITIDDCKILSDTISTSTAKVPIHKATATGTLRNFVVKNCYIEGGYYGIEFHGDNSGTIACFVYMDNNTICKQYYCGMYIYDTHLSSASYNTVTTRSAYQGNIWWGMLLNLIHREGTISYNRIYADNPNIKTQIVGLYTDIIQDHLVANNDVYINSSAQGIYGMVINQPVDVNYLHNTVFVNGTSSVEENWALEWDVSTGSYYNATVKNNIFVANGGVEPCAIALYGTYNTPSAYRLDYNNYYSSGDLGVAGNIYRADLAAWKAAVTQDAHSVSVLPGFANPTVDLQLDAPTYANSSLYAPWQMIRTDRNGKIRQDLATMGAYERPPSGTDLMALKIYPTDNKVIDNQVVTISIDARNIGANAINSATFGLRVNGINRQTTPYNPSVALGSYQEDHIPIGTFTVTNTSNMYDVEAWIETVNGATDMAQWNDTLSAMYVTRSLAEFVPPFIKGTIYQLAFDVFASIYEGSGAPVTPPKLYTHTIIRGKFHLYDSIVMKKEGDKWVALVPKQYYDSKFIYWLPVSDAMGNSIILMDSVEIKMPFSVPYTATIQPGRTIGIGNGTAQANPYTFTWDYGYSRNHYRAWEIDPARRGGIITSIAFDVQSNVVAYTDDISFFLKAVTDSICYTADYIEPIGDGATLVWGPATANPRGSGWLTFNLHTPFYLPPNMNLLMYCDNKNGHFIHGYTTTFFYSEMDINTSAYSLGDYDNPPGYSFPPNFETKITNERCNIQITMKEIDVYSGYNLGLLSVLSPVNRLDNMCEDPTTEVKVLMVNTGEYDYNFAQNNVTIRYEITEPSSTVNRGNITLSTGRLRTGLTDTVTVISAMPLLPGTYGIKIWLESSLDNIKYDDTIASTYISMKTNLPVDEDFSKGFIPSDFIHLPTIIGNDNWEVYTPAPGDKVQPNVGTGVLRFLGGAGVDANLSTRQVDFYGAQGSKLEFWYYHDATTDERDDSYTEVVVNNEGKLKSILIVYKRDAVSGWKHYKVDLTPYIYARCVSVEFRAMNMDRTGKGSQYIDRIHIYTQQNLSLDTLIIPALSVCNNKNRAVQVAMHNTSPLTLDFTKYNTEIKLEVRKEGAVVKTGSAILNTGSLVGLASTTVTLATMDLDTGVYDFIAWVDVPIDEIPMDDTVSNVIAIYPDVAITALRGTTPSNCFMMNRLMAQTVTIHNRGTFDINYIPFSAEIVGSTGIPEILRDTLQTVVRAGTSRNVAFRTPYTVPVSEIYKVNVAIEVPCDLNPKDNQDTIEECVDMYNMRVIGLVEPSGTVDNVGDSIYLKVNVENLSPTESFFDVGIYAIVSVSGMSDILFTETIDSITPASVYLHAFASGYVVPKVNNYTVKVFIDQKDHYPSDDTLRATRSTNNRIANMPTGSGFTLGQNIPNPASGNTRIEYSIPNDGQVIFTVYTITGQTLHIEKRESHSGKNELEYNTINLANGIYYYSMEYKGERLVKKMTIRK